MTWLRGASFIALVVLLAMTWAFMDPAARRPSTGVTQAAVPHDPPSRSGIFVMERPFTSDAPIPVAPASMAAAPTRREPPPLPFAFLGRVTEGGETAVVLYRAGRTFKVRGPGPLADDYHVDAILDDLLVIRYIPLGARQFLELASRQQMPTPYGSAADTPQD